MQSPGELHSTHVPVDEQMPEKAPTVQPMPIVTAPIVGFPAASQPFVVHGLPSSRTSVMSGTETYSPSAPQMVCLQSPLRWLAIGMPVRGA
jgi:hypothetical protein